MTRERITVACATQRGLRFLQRLVAIKPSVDLVACSFREQPWEPPYLDDIRSFVTSRGGTFIETTNLASPAVSRVWHPEDSDLLFFVNWRYLVPRTVYGLPARGTFAFHDSLLPEYRGFSPTNWAIINGEDHTGATLFQVADEMDAGDIVDQARVPIMAADSIAAVMDRVLEAYLELLTNNLDSLLRGSASHRRQDHSRATYTCRRSPDDNLIDWHRSDREIYNLVRAVTRPYPGAFTYLDGRKLTVWKASLPDQPHPYVGAIPGRVAEVRPGEGSLVLTGRGSILVERVQLEGHDEVAATELLGSLSQQLGAGPTNS